MEENLHCPISSWDLRVSEGKTFPCTHHVGNAAAIDHSMKIIIITMMIAEPLLAFHFLSFF
jgi:hypothetical protein